MTAAEQALAGGEPAFRDMFMRDADRGSLQPVHYQAPTQPRQPGLRPAPSQPAHGPSLLDPRFVRDKAMLKLNPTPAQALEFFRKQPGALLDFADGVDEKLGAVRNREGKLVNGTGLSRETIGGAIIQILPSVTAQEQARMMSLQDKNVPLEC